MDSLLYRSRQAWFFQQGWTPLQSIIPALAGSIMLLTGVLPWVIEPLGGSYSAWDLPFNIGWPFLPTALFNYGLFCLGYGIYTLVIAYQNWQALKNNKPSSAQRPTLAGILCLSLPACFLWQFLGVDMGSVNVLAQHQVQALLTQNNFGYNVPAALFPLDLSSWDVSTFAGRFVLLADNAGVGLFLPLLCGLMLLSSRQLFKQPLVKTIRPGEKQKLFIRRLLAIGTFGMLAVALVCGLGALACEYQAKTFLATGDYTTSLSWLDTVRILNPSFDQVPFYHIERGQAWYFLHNRQLNDETSIYLAHNYRLQRYYADAYQQLILVWDQGDRPSWLRDEISITLEQYAQSFRPLTSINAQAANTLNTTQPTSTTSNLTGMNSTGQSTTMPGSNSGMTQMAQGTGTTSSSATMNNSTGQNTTNNPVTVIDTNATILPVQRIANDTSALPWLQRLQQIDPSNIYAQYLSGRIQYDLHNYDICKEEMYGAIQSTRNKAVQSSAYTYIALSDAQQGDYVSSRQMLLKAASLDPSYYNNTAREQLSGLH